MHGTPSRYTTIPVQSEVWLWNLKPGYRLQNNVLEAQQCHFRKKPKPQQVEQMLYKERF